MNAVRLLVIWAAIEPQKGVYDDKYLDALADRVKWASDANLAVIVDMHQDVYGEGFAIGGGDGAPLWTCDASHYTKFVPTNPWFINDFNAEVLACYDGFWSDPENQTHFVEAWRRVAARLSGFEAIVGFDVLNEPYWGTYSVLAFEQDKLQPLYERVVPVVRGEAPGWVAFLEPSSLRNGGGHTRLTSPSFANFAYAPHSYDRNAESGNGFDPMQRGFILSNVASLADEARELGGALWIGEYGTPQDAMGLVEYMSAQYDAAGAVAGSSMYWSYAKGGYGILNEDGSESMPLADVLVRPYPERVAGDPIDWTFANGAFTMRWHPSEKIAAPTIVSVPKRRYPQGYAVDCACVWHADGASVVVTSATSDPAILNIR
jgi:endoglycosylceramidase